MTEVVETAPPPPRARLLWSRLRGLGGSAVGLLAVLALLVATMSQLEPAFLSIGNLSNLLRGFAIPAVLAVGMTLVLLTAGIDLSIGAVLGAGGVIYAALAFHGVPPWLACVAAVGAGLALGLANGFLVGRVGMSFFVVTLGSMSVIRGVTLLATDNQTVDAYDDGFSHALGDATLFGGVLPVPFLVAFAIVAGASVVLGRTVFGREIYATGGNREAAELSGIDAGAVIMGVYAASGALAALAGVMTVGRTTVVLPSAGLGVELRIAAAALLGGASLSGGAGGVWGSVLGVLFLEVLSNALNFAGLSSFWQLLLTGGILLFAVYLDRLRERARRF